MDVCRPVEVQALRWADLQSKEYYQMSTNEVPKPGETRGLGLHWYAAPHKKKVFSVLK
jgi:hypothetical protein